MASTSLIGKIAVFSGAWQTPRPHQVDRLLDGATHAGLRQPPVGSAGIL
jgi:hypothetical protein